MSETRPVAVAAEGVAKVFGTGTAQVDALRDVNLQVAVGEFVAVMGPSGSGKSTLLHVVSGLEPASAGRVLLDNCDLGTIDDDQLTLLRRRKLGFVFQAFNLLDVLTAVENVALPLVIDGNDERGAQTRARDALAQMGLAHRADHRPGELSGGEQQRVAIARALITRPLILMADEPTGNLDTANGDQIMHLLRRLVDEQRQTILMVTHDVTHAALADRVIVLRDGQIVEERRQQPTLTWHGEVAASP